MNNIHILDCTLRDGGYCNNWQFGKENITSIINGLEEANVDIIECGFITEKASDDINVTKYKSVEQIEQIVTPKQDNRIYVAMMNYGEYDINMLPNCDGKSIDGIRVAFHKKDRYDALKLCRQIKEKGYLVFVQAMVAPSYSDEEYLEMLQIVNEFMPYSFYIVDSFGMMKGKDLTRLFYMIEHNLKEEIWIGFHCHNNIQLAYSNAQKLASIQTSRNLIIDASIMGMGRGAGNLNTELFVDYLNDNANKNYEIKPLLNIMDNILTSFYERKFWGYSLPNYISAVHSAHPNYADFLDAKKTLTYEDMNNIFELMDEGKKYSFDKEYIEEIYLKYQEKNRVQELHKAEFQSVLQNKKVLIIAPGKSVEDEKEEVLKYARRDDVITISINYDYDADITDYIFVSNRRRFGNIPNDKREKCIITSNIAAVDVYLQVLYKSLLNSTEPVRDNAGLMLLQLLINNGVKRVFIAGMDGYSPNSEENYANRNMVIYLQKDLSERYNFAMSKVMKELSLKIDMVMITTPKYIKI